MDKLIEHIRHIFFAFIAIGAALAYITLAVQRSAPDLTKELEAFGRLIENLDTVQARLKEHDRRQPIAVNLRELLGDVLTSLNPELVAAWRQEYRAQLEQLTEASASTEVVDAFLLSEAPTMEHNLSMQMSLAMLLRGIAILQFDLQTMWPDHRIGGALPLQTEQQRFHLEKPIIIPSAERVQLTRGGYTSYTLPNLATGTPGTRSVYERLPGTDISVAVTPRKQSIYIEETMLDTRFPKIQRLSDKYGHLSIDKLKSAVAGDRDNVISRQSAKVFDIPIEGRDVAIVSVGALALCLLYLAAFASQARTDLLNTADKVDRREMSETRSLWVGTHQSGFKHVVDAAIVVIVCMAIWSLWEISRLQTWPVRCLASILVIVACMALTAISKLRKTM